MMVQALPRLNAHESRGVKGTPTAAVTFVVDSLDGEGVVDALAQSVAALWDLPHEKLNGVVATLGDDAPVE